MSHYETLRIAPTASPDEVKRAYYRQVREYPPEKAPEQFQKIREAYETLMEPQGRKRYDAMIRHGGEITELLGQAFRFKEAGDNELAVARFKRVLALTPDDDATLNQLGICYCRLKRYDDAVTVYEKLLRGAADVALYWANYGQTFHQQADSLRADDFRRPPLYQKTRDAYHRAIGLDPTNTEYHVYVAQTYVGERRFNEAAASCERGAAARGDRPDFDALFYLCEVYLFAGELDQIVATARRIRAALPDDEDARRYAASRFGKFGLDLHKANLYEPARTFYEAARQFDPYSPQLQELAATAGRVADASAEYPRLKEDGSLAEGIRRLVTYFLCDVFGEGIATRKEVFDSIFEQIFSHHPPLLVSSVRRLRSRYPNCYQLNAAAFDKIEQAARGAMAPRPASGCFVVTATFGTPEAAEVGRFRHFRDEYLTRSALGRAVIAAYSRVGPPLADWVRPRPRVRRVLAWLLGGLAKVLPREK